MNRLRLACEDQVPVAAIGKPPRRQFDSVPPVSLLRRLAGPFFIVAGALHFVIPGAYHRIMPPYVPAPRAMVYASGVAEMAGGAGLLTARSRPAAG